MLEENPWRSNLLGGYELEGNEMADGPTTGEGIETLGREAKKT